jgi:hypothetical protein
MGGEEIHFVKELRDLGPNEIGFFTRNSVVFYRASPVE